MLAQKETFVSNPRKSLLEMMQGYIKPQLIYVAAKLGIADCLKTGPASLEKLTSQTQADPKALGRILRGLVNIGLLEHNKGGQYELTQLGNYLASDTPQSMREIAILQGEEIFQAWGNLLYSVQTGRPAFEQVMGSEFFGYFACHPEASVRFNCFMANTGSFAARAFRTAYDFSAVRQVVDVGGGNGVLLATILEGYPDLKGCLFDGTETVNPAYLELCGVMERCQIVQGDFFKTVPDGADCYMLSQILHDWDDQRAEQILRNCHSSMPDGAKLLIYEQLLPEEINVPNPAVELDLVMLVLTGGRERTQTEFKDLLERANFRLNRVIPTRHERSILEAIPVKTGSGIE